MADEQSYTSHLCTYKQAMDCLSQPEGKVLRYARDVYIDSLQYQAEERLRRSSLSQLPPPTVVSIPLYPHMDLCTPPSQISSEVSESPAK